MCYRLMITLSRSESFGFVMFRLFDRGSRALTLLCESSLPWLGRYLVMGGTTLETCPLVLELAVGGGVWSECQPRT